MSKSDNIRDQIDSIFKQGALPLKPMKVKIFVGDTVQKLELNLNLFFEQNPELFLIEIDFKIQETEYSSRFICILTYKDS